MTFDQLPFGSSVFLDANILVFDFQPHPLLARPATNS